MSDRPGTIAVTTRWTGIAAAAVYAALCTLGLFAGGAYAGLVIGLAAVLLIGGLAAGEGWPFPDRPLAALAVLLVLLCWLSAAWSIVPGHTLRGALQLTGIFAACLVLLAEARLLAASREVVLRAALVAAVIGPILVVGDFLLGHPIMRHIVSHSASAGALDVKFDRGLSYQTILLWPILAQVRSGARRLWAVAAILVLAAALALGYSTSAQLSFVAALATLAVAALLPGLVAAGLALLAAFFALATPFAVEALAGRFTGQAAALKPSFGHRLEIWDYVSARALERPWSGWGWWSTHALPITSAELARYHYVSSGGTAHPHNNWLQLWAETGVFGAALGLAFALVILLRIRRMPPGRQPFALASVAAAMVISLGSFDLATDSWWCCLAAAGLLFTILPEPAPQGLR